MSATPLPARAPPLLPLPGSTMSAQHHSAGAAAAIPPSTTLLPLRVHSSAWPTFSNAPLITRARQDAEYGASSTAAAAAGPGRMASLPLADRLEELLLRRGGQTCVAALHADFRERITGGRSDFAQAAGMQIQEFLREHAGRFSVSAVSGHGSLATVSLRRYVARQQPAAQPAPAHMMPSVPLMPHMPLHGGSFWNPPPMIAASVSSSSPSASSASGSSEEQATSSMLAAYQLQSELTFLLQQARDSAELSVLERAHATLCGRAQQIAPLHHFVRQRTSAFVLSSPSAPGIPTLQVSICRAPWRSDFNRLLPSAIMPGSMRSEAVTAALEADCDSVELQLAAVTLLLRHGPLSPMVLRCGMMRLLGVNGLPDDASMEEFIREHSRQLRFLPDASLIALAGAPMDPLQQRGNSSAHMQASRSSACGLPSVAIRNMSPAAALAAQRNAWLTAKLRAMLKKQSSSGSAADGVRVSELGLRLRQSERDLGIHQSQCISTPQLVHWLQKNSHTFSLSSSFVVTLRHPAGEESSSRPVQIIQPEPAQTALCRSGLTRRPLRTRNSPAAIASGTQPALDSSSPSQTDDEEQDGLEQLLDLSLAEESKLGSSCSPCSPASAASSPHSSPSELRAVAPLSPADECALQLLPALPADMPASDDTASDNP